MFLLLHNAFIYNVGMPTPRTHSDTQLGAELLQLINRLNRWSSLHTDTRLPLARIRLLAWIEDLGAARISDLAHADNCSQPAITMQVRKLERDRLVQRRMDPADARASLISLTPAGRTLLAEVRTARAATIAPLVRTFNKSHGNDLHKALATLSRLLELTRDNTPTD